MVTTTRAIRQRGVPAGSIATKDFEITERPLGAPADGEVLLQVLLVSVDPYLVMRVRAGDFEQGIMRSRLIGRVLNSRALDIAEGDLVLGFGRWQDYEVMPAGELRIIRPVLPLPAYLGFVGHSGYTALLGMETLDVQPGQTFTVSSAAGAVGTVAGQLAKLAGARVIGIAGGSKAQAIVDRYGFDAGVDWRATDLRAALAEAAPDGIDRHFENVGASMLDPVLDLANMHARIALCGLISHYADDDPICLANFRQLLLKRISLNGFSIYDQPERYPEGLAQLEQLVLDGKLKSYETITDGFESLPAAFVAMLNGDGFGKHMVRIADQTDTP